MEGAFCVQFVNGFLNGSRSRGCALTARLLHGPAAHAGKRQSDGALQDGCGAIPLRPWPSSSATGWPARGRGARSVAEATFGLRWRLWYVEIKPRPRGRSDVRRPVPVSAVVTPGWAGTDNDPVDRETDASEAVTALYRRHALGLTRLAFLMLGDRQTAEDVVQEAFCGLYRAWDRISDHAHALGYVRTSVLNGCRSALRRSKRVPQPLAVPPAASAEAMVLAGERQRETITALRRLPSRQREALVLRYFADLSQDETALAMGVSPGTVKSTTSRALAALARLLPEEEL